MPLLRSLLAVLLLCLSVLAATAQTVAPAAPSQTPRPDVEAMRQEMTYVETQIQRENLEESELNGLRARLNPVIEGVLAIIARETPRLEEINARLERIGPAPKENEPKESAEVTRNRGEQAALKKEIDEVIRVARLLQVRADQAAAAIVDYRRRLFAREILQRSDSIVSPWLWADALRAIPDAVTDFTALVRFRWRQTVANLEGPKTAVAFGLLFLMALAYAPARRLLLRRFDAWKEDETGVPSRGQRALGAAGGTLLRTLLPLVIAILVAMALRTVGLGVDRLGELLRTIMLSFAILAFLRGLLVGVLQPDRPAWRVAQIEQRSVAIIFPTLWTITVVVFLGKILEAVTQSISAALPITVAVKGVTALVAAALLVHALRRIDQYQESQEQALDEFGPSIGGGAGNTIAIMLKIVGWLAAIAVSVSALLGYIALAAFMTDQFVWLLAIGAFLGLGLIIVEEFLGRGTASENALTRRIRASTGIPPASIRQFGVLASGLIRLLIYSVGLLLALAPFGVNSGDLFGSVQAALFGFQVGGVTVSIWKIVTAILLFFLLVFVSRAIQRWVEKVWLPSTSLDSGLQNSISTVIGYIGFAVALLAALSHFGLSLDRIAIIAGALSVGIGFGLQSIAGNFVSGLILLWERPIKVGDLIVVGADTGRVRRINVRSTEIETADRSSLIVPNSEFISGRVKNLMHANRIARIVIPISVSPTADPNLVRATLLESANAHMEVMTNPAAEVLFLDVTSTALSFELRCFVDIDAQVSVRSDLMFDIFRRLKELTIVVPPPKQPIAVDDVRALFAAITGGAQKS